MHPQYRRFTGEIFASETGKKYKSVGKCREVEPDVIMIEELPISKWTNDQKADFLDMNLSIRGGHIED